MYWPTIRSSAWRARRLPGVQTGTTCCRTARFGPTLLPLAGKTAPCWQGCPPELRRLLKFPLDVCATVSPCSSSDPANMEANGSVFSQSPCPHPSQQRVSRQVLYNHTARRVRGPEGIWGASAPVTGRKDRRATARRRWRRADAVTTQVGTLTGTSPRSNGFL